MTDPIADGATSSELATAGPNATDRTATGRTATSRTAINPAADDATTVAATAEGAVSRELTTGEPTGNRIAADRPTGESVGAEPASSAPPRPEPAGGSAAGTALVRAEPTGTALTTADSTGRDPAGPVRTTPEPGGAGPASDAPKDPADPSTAVAPADSRIAGAADDEHYARAWLSRAAEPGDRLLWAFVETYGSVATMRALRRAEAPERLQALVGRRYAEDRAADDLRLARRRGIRLVVPGDPEWPEAALRPMAYAAGRGSTTLVPPLAFWVRGVGRLDEAVASAVAMVGSRAASDYGTRAAEELGFGLAERGWTIVSGGAFGIDAASHRAALAANGTTVAVLAGGLDKPYPAGNSALFERINDTGLLISEWPPGCAPMRRRFLIRNRVVAGLAAGTIVVEAAARSGAHSTAARARELGQPLMVVPGPVFSATSVGSLTLLRTEGVRPVGTLAHVLEEIGRIGDDLAPPEPGHVDVRDHLDATQRAVLDAVPVRRPVEVERIAVAAGVSTADVLRVLPALELSDLVELTDRGWRLGSAARGRSDPSGRDRPP